MARWRERLGEKKRETPIFLMNTLYVTHYLKLLEEVNPSKLTHSLRTGKGTSFNISGVTKQIIYKDHSCPDLFSSLSLVIPSLLSLTQKMNPNLFGVGKHKCRHMELLLSGAHKRQSVGV